MKHFPIYYLILLLAFSGISFPTPQDYSFRQLGIEEGLSQSTVFASLQDQTGYMWFGTSSGLNRYDGYDFTVYLNNPEDSGSISGEVFVSLFEDSNGALWISSMEGYINKYNRLTDSFNAVNVSSLISEKISTENDYYEYPLSFSRNHNFTVTSMVEDDNGFMWMATWGNGILVIDKNFNLIRHHFHDKMGSSTLPGNRITKLVKDENGVIWIGTFGQGLVKCIQSPDGTSQFIRYQTSGEKNNSLSDDKIITMLLDSKSNLWIGTFYGGLSFLSKEEKQRQPVETQFITYRPDPGKNSISNRTIMSICEDNRNHIWIGTFGTGLDRFNQSTKKFINFRNNPLNANSLADNDVLSLSTERSGIIWAGSHLGSGITKIQRSRTKFNLYRNEPENPNSLSDDVIWSVYEDRSKILWVGTYRGGLNRIERQSNNFRHFYYDSTNSNTITSDHIRSIAEDDYGNIWAGTYNKGLNIIQKDTYKIRRISSNESSDESLSANQIQSILIDKKEIWIGSFGGGINYAVIKGDPFKNKIEFKRLLHDNTDDKTLSDNRVYKIFKDSKGTIWVGTFGGGLNKYDPTTKTFQHFRHNPIDPESLADDKVICIMEDSEGNLWIGTYGGGLNKFDISTEKFARLSHKDGLSTSVIYGILEDSRKNLWLSTDNGIFSINYVSKKVSRYDILDGLQSKEFSGGCYFKSPSGEMFFGGIDGLNYFYPDSIKENTFLPPVVITSIKVQNEPVRGNLTELSLEHDRNFISFEFASLDYTNPKENVYSYILEGFDKTWQTSTSERRMANYTNLPAGSYTFRVRGSNSDGLWSNEEAVLSLLINPPFWQTWWFIFLSIIITGSILYYISTLRIKNLLAIEKLKTKLAADLHDNIGSGLTEISILSELASFKAGSGNPESRKELKIISDMARQLIDNMSDIVWVVNPQRDSLHDLIVRLKNSYGETLNSLGISLKVSNIEKLKDIKLPIDFKQNLYLILKEAINNAIKHSKCSIIHLEANARKDIIEVSVTDDGIGLGENYFEFGNGIKNIKLRAESIGGRVKWRSSPNQGTSLRFVGRRSTLTKIKSFFRK